MAKETKTTTIDGRTYVLKKCHQLKALGGHSLGKVPVRMFTAAEFSAFINAATECDIDIVIKCFRYGLSVDLQKQARAADAGGGYTDADHNKMFNGIPADILVKYAGNGKALDEYCKEQWLEQQKDGKQTYDDDYVWEDFAYIFSDEK